jgi:hypothetical protein
MLSLAKICILLDSFSSTFSFFNNPSRIPHDLQSSHLLNALIGGESFSDFSSHEDIDSIKEDISSILQIVPHWDILFSYELHTFMSYIKAYVLYYVSFCLLTVFKVQFHSIVCGYQGLIPHLRALFFPQFNGFGFSQTPVTVEGEFYFCILLTVPLNCLLILTLLSYNNDYRCFVVWFGTEKCKSPNALFFFTIVSEIAWNAMWFSDNPACFYP